MACCGYATGRSINYIGVLTVHFFESLSISYLVYNHYYDDIYRHQTQLYIAKDYAVIPLGARSGLIQWVDNITPLFGIYKRWQQREAYAKALEQVRLIQIQYQHTFIL